MKERELTPLEQILEEVICNAEKRMWDSLTEVIGLKEDIAILTEFLPRLETLSKKLASLQVDMATIRIDMKKRKSKKRK